MPAALLQGTIVCACSYNFELRQIFGLLQAFELVELVVQLRQFPVRQRLSKKHAYNEKTHID